MNIKGEILTLIKKCDIRKTLYFNFKNFRFRYAVKLPVFIYRRTVLVSTKGCFEIVAPVQTGMVKIGSHTLGNKDPRYNRTILQLDGLIKCRGRVNIGRGSKIVVESNGVLTLGSNFVITGSSDIICSSNIEVGCDCLLSWDILIMDNDYHFIDYQNDNEKQTTKPIIIGNHVWIGCRSLILKGTKIANDSVVAAQSVIRGNYENANVLIGSTGILKKNISWSD